MTAMEQFCGGEIFWDTELTWTNNSWPQFTDCFQNTVLQWIPCIWLWLSAPIYIYHLSSLENSIQPIRILICTKLFCTLFLFFVCLMEIVGAVDRLESQDFNDEILAPLLWIVTLMLHVALVLLEKSHNIFRSPVLFIYWILASSVTLISLYTAAVLQMYESDFFRFFILCTKYAFTTFCVFLNCFSSGYQGIQLGYNPEARASILRWLTFAWLNGIVFKAFKAPLSDEDIHELHPADRSKKVVNKFLVHWNKEKCRSLRKNKNQILRKRHQSPNDKEPSEKTPLLSAPSRDSTHSQMSVCYSHTSLANPEDYNKSYMLQEHPATASFFKSLFRCYWLETIKSEWGFITYVIDGITSPIILGMLISFTKDLSERAWHGYIYTLAFIALKLLYTTFGVRAKYLANRLSLRARSAVMSTVFRKALTMNCEARRELTVGEIVNLMSVDAGHIEDMFDFMYSIFATVIFLIVGLYLLFTIVGLALLAGLSILLAMFIVNLWVMHKMREYQDQIMDIKDERVKVVNEVLNGIKVIKLYGWEPMFIKKIEEIREQELRILLKNSLCDSVETFAWVASMFWMLYLMLVTFVFIDDDHHLDANTSFLTMNYIDVLQLSVNILPIIVKDWTKAISSSARLTKSLNSKDLDPDSLARNRTDCLAVRIVEADFAWEQHGPSVLNNISLSVNPGKLVAVVGMVGSGKSSLLSAMLGEMHKVRGYVNLSSSVAYVPQQAWIQNSTLKENILFGQSFDDKFYHQVVSACALQPDLDILPARDSTEIGEKGINLSGGQKQRVSFARAVYSQADIYLLDDPLSAVDSHVGRHIFDQVLSKEGLLCNKTRILVTHGIQWLPEVDHIIVMNDGKISESGTYEELISHNGAFAQFLTQYLMQTEAEKADDIEEDQLDKNTKTDILKSLVSVTSDNDSPLSPEKVDLNHDNDSPLSPEEVDLKYLLSHEIGKSLHHDGMMSEKISSKKRKESRHRTYSEMSAPLEVNGNLETETILDTELSVQEGDRADKSRLTSDEAMAGSKVKWSVYWEVIKGMGLKYAIIVLFFFLAHHVLYNYNIIWLANWTDDLRLNNFTAMPSNSTARNERNIYYIGVFTAVGICQTLFAVLYSVFLQVRHISASRKLHAELLDCIMKAPISFFDTTPIGRILNRFSQDVEILDSDVFLEVEAVTDAFMRCAATFIIVSYTMPLFISVVVPIIILLFVTQQFYIRASCQLRRISSNNRSPVYAHFSETLSGVSVIRAYQAQDRFITDSQKKVDKFVKSALAAKALTKWLETRTDILNYIVMAAAGVFTVLTRENLSPGLVGLIITYAKRVSWEMNIFTREFGNLENHIVSVERIREYSVIKSEAAWSCPNDGQKAEDQWPSCGNVQFVNYSTRYRDGLDLVLKGLNCNIQGGEKVGIVGRTGAGKSSMVLSLFRLIEAASGRVIIDGVDIALIGLHALRRKLTILPQDPVLFAGSLRMNLDPFQEKTDYEIWIALEHSHLKTFVEGLAERLDHEVGEGGENLSMGQRQLVCLARTLLRKTKILILDEATAAVDMETDDLIQKTICKEFSDCTILTIAHRLNTVMDYDRIMVLQSGKIIEFDAPTKLLADPNSEFFSMAKSAGLVVTEEISNGNNIVYS